MLQERSLDVARSTAGLLGSRDSEALWVLTYTRDAPNVSCVVTKIAFLGKVSVPNLFARRPIRQLIPKVDQHCAAAQQELGEVFYELTERPEQAQFDEFAIHRHSSGFPLRLGSRPFLTPTRVSKLHPHRVVSNFCSAAKLGDCYET
jgi:hypothetical protein